MKKYIKKEFTCICKKCGKQYIINTSQENFDKGNYTKYCSISCRNSHKHSKYTKNKISNSLKNYYSSTDEIINSDKQCPDGFKQINNKIYKLYNCKNCNKEFTILDNNHGRTYCCDECRNDWIKNNSNRGGKREGSGRGKKGWYKNIYCDSSWELAFVIYNLDKGNDIKRYTESREYDYNGKIHKYYPDFIVNNKIYEIKGYKTEQWNCKEKQNQDVIVIDKDKISIYLDYVIKTYGTDFIKLYDGSNPKLEISNKKRLWMTKGASIKNISPSEYENYILKGWTRGRHPNK